MSAFVSVLGSLLLTAARNIGAAFLAKKTIIWALRLLAKLSKNTQVDDNVVELLSAAVDNDVAEMQRRVELITADLSRPNE